MAYIAYIIALVGLLFQDTKGMSFNQGVDQFLSNAVEINKIFCFVAVVIWLIIAILFLLAMNSSGSFKLNIKITGCGCIFSLFSSYPSARLSSGA